MNVKAHHGNDASGAVSADQGLDYRRTGWLPDTSERAWSAFASGVVERVRMTEPLPQKEVTKGADLRARKSPTAGDFSRQRRRWLILPDSGPTPESVPPAPGSA